MEVVTNVTGERDHLRLPGFKLHQADDTVLVLCELCGVVEARHDFELFDLLYPGLVALPSRAPVAAVSGELQNRPDVEAVNV